MAFCFRCGSLLVDKMLEDRHRLACPECGWVYYPQLKVSAAALVEMEGKILLVRRRNPPWKGCWYLPAGYVEEDENPAAAAERELLEETGLKGCAEKLIGAYYFSDDPRGSGILLVYTCQVIGGTIIETSEVEEAGYFCPLGLPVNITGAGHQHAIHDWEVRKKIAGSHES